MTFFAAQIEPSAFKPFSLAEAYQEGQQVRENEMKLEDQNNLLNKKRQLDELFKSSNGDLMNPQVQAKWSQIDPVSQQEYVQKIQKMAAERSDHIEGATKKMAAILSSLPPDKRTPEYEAQVISDYKNSLMPHDPWIAHAIPTDPAGIQRIKEFGGYQTPEQARQAKLQDMQDKIQMEQALDRPSASTIYTQNAIDKRNADDRQTELAKASQPKLDESTGALVYPALNGQQPRIEYPLNTPKAIQDRQAYDSTLTSLDNLYKNITSLENHKGLNRILGTIDGRTPDMTTDAADAEALRQEIISKSALGTMQALKSASSSGATGFGALSEGELKLLQSAEANLARTQDVNQFKKQLDELKTMIQNRKQQAYRGMTARYGNSVVAPLSAPQQQYPEGTIRSKGALKQIFRNGNWEEMR